MPLTVEFGAMAPPLKRQIPGLKDAQILQREADSIACLQVHGLLTDAETRKIRLRLMKRIGKGIA